MSESAINCKKICLTYKNNATVVNALSLSKQQRLGKHFNLYVESEEALSVIEKIKDV